jgi:enediyne biosynthesis protein E4
MRFLWLTAVLAVAGVLAPVQFQNGIGASAVRFRHAASHTPEKYLPETMGAGVALLDYDGDGQLDIFFVNGASVPEFDKSRARFWNRLYRNLGDGSFQDVTEATGMKGDGYGMGVAVADYDNDGRPDIFVTNYGSNSLYHNENGSRFREVTGAAGVASGGWSTGAIFVDYDRDGKLDLFVARYLEWTPGGNLWCGPQKAHLRGYCHPNAFRSTTHRLFHNEGNQRFRDVSEQSRIASHPGKGLGVAINDFDLDGWPDILVANDSEPQQLFRNNHDGTFSDVALQVGIGFNVNGQSFAGMGTDFADYNNDGKPDIFINALSLQGYALFRNAGDVLEDDSETSGVTRASLRFSGWGAKFVDLDNDGWKDLLVGQGHVMDTISIDFPQISYRQKLLLLRNVQGRFADVSESAGTSFQTPLAARGVAFGDLDNDGRVDAVVSTNDGAPLILMNRSKTRGHWIEIKAEGTRSNRDGIGARVRISASPGRSQYGYVSTASSYLSASDVRLHFGVGSALQIREIQVDWPSGNVQRLSNVQTDRVITIREGW